jgi:hypothetical protein
MNNESLLTLLDEAFDKKSWHGPNLRGAIRGVTAQQAAWRPRPGAHNIWEFTLHAAYWKYVVWRKITRAKRGTFPLPGTNFFERPVELTEAAWKKDIQLLESAHRDLRAVVPQAGRPALYHMLRGAAFHDIYHAGQIRLLRKLMEEKK